MMKLLFTVAVLVALLAVGESRITFGESRVALEPVRSHLSGWTNTRTAPKDKSTDIRQLVIGIKQSNLDVLEETFWAVSDPTSERYGEHLTNDEITAIVAPAAESVDAVTEWVSSFATEYKLLANRDWIRVDLDVATIETVFGVEFNTWTHADGREFTATLGPYYVPRHIAAHVDIVTGITGLPTESRHVQLGENDPTGSSTSSMTDITPAVVRAAYGVPPTLVGTNANNSHAVAEFQGQYYAASDLSDFFSMYVNYSTSDTIDQLIGWNNPNAASLEGSLDIEFAMGICPDINTTFYSYKSFNFYNDLNVWQATLSDTAEIPFVISVSYGTQGDYPSEDYRTRADTEYMKIGTRGTSIIYASGDYGACGDGSCSLLYASYPATSVYVTSVGATRFISGNSGEEAAVEAFLSGGGFSDFYDVPSYQAQYVADYVQNAPALPMPGAYNSSKRGTPDVAALGSEHFTVVINGAVTLVGGTSAAAPSFASIIALLNDAKLNNGDATLGFLNPWIYQTWAADPTTFNDITVGNNECEQSSSSSYACGYSCISGWDPVTGVGTPNYAALLNHV